MALTKTVRCQKCGDISEPFFPKNQERMLERKGWTRALEGWICAKPACRNATGARYNKIPAAADSLYERRHY